MEGEMKEKRKRGRRKGEREDKGERDEGIAG